ncbi:ATP synthase subunit b chloroplastic [Bienertia sinuspersici]
MAPREEDIARNLEDTIDWNKQRIRCKLCNKIINGGITRLKQHLSHKRDDVAPCESVSPNVLKRYDGTDDPEMEFALRLSRQQHEFDYCCGAYNRGRTVIMMKGVLIFPAIKSINISS